MKKLFAFFCLLASSLFGGDFYGIVVAQTDLDLIDVHVFLDYSRIKYQMIKVAKHLDREFQLIEFTEEKVISDEIISRIDELEFQKDDIVFFYFSGHGQQSGNSWPLMKMNGRTAINLSTIAAKLLEKQPRLVMAIADCCNHPLSVAPVEVFFSEPKGEGNMIADKERMRLNCQKLFLDQTGLILVSSSLSGTPSFSDMLGSHFTRFFHQALYSELREEETNWEIIFQKASEHLGDAQFPQVEVIPSNEEAQEYINNL